jgi:hypothetical protein
MSDDVVAAGVAAWRRLRGNATFEDWVSVARALAVGRAECMAAAKTNKPMGTTYNRLMGLWLRRHELEEVDAGERCKCMRLLDQLTEIEQWRAPLTDAEKRRWNHPGAVLARWKASMKSDRHIVARKKPAGNLTTAAGKQVFWPGVMIERAAVAIHEANTNDTYILARKALEAALRGENDVQELLDQPKSKPSAPATRARSSAKGEQPVAMGT